MYFFIVSMLLEFLIDVRNISNKVMILPYMIKRRDLATGFSLLRFCPGAHLFSRQGTVHTKKQIL